MLCYLYIRMFATASTYALACYKLSYTNKYASAFTQVEEGAVLEVVGTLMGNTGAAGGA